jgi:hypothetical protein
VTGLLELDDPVCGRSDPSRDTTDESGPNGRLSWLNCGISKTDPSAGWTYPDVKMSDIVYKNLTKGGLYSICEPYFPLFEKAEAEYGIPAIFVAAFAMQESVRLLTSASLLVDLRRRLATRTPTVTTAELGA